MSTKDRWNLELLSRIIQTIYQTTLKLNYTNPNPFVLTVLLGIDRFFETVRSETFIKYTRIITGNF